MTESVVEDISDGAVQREPRAMSGALRARPRARTVLVAASAVAALAWGTHYARGIGRESTDDAEVEGHIVNVSPRIAGCIREVLVRDNQLVEAGQPLVQLEVDELELRASAAEAELAGATAMLASAEARLALTQTTVSASTRQAEADVSRAASSVGLSRSSLSGATADLAAAEARRALADQELARTRVLVGEQSAPGAKLEAAQAEFDAAVAAVGRARAGLLGAQSNISGSSSGVQAARARLAQALAGPHQVAEAEASIAAARSRVSLAKATLELAKLNIGHARITAPLRGIVSRRTAEPGQIASPDRPLLAIVGTDDVWIVANFKEDQAAKFRPDMTAQVAIDAFPDHPFEARVDSLGGASGARFSLLPADNASGNFVKVVQRIPVLVRLDAPSNVPIRPGMSAYVTVNTGPR
jgi:membrane fusion protein (multidrug efflux system)